MTFLGFLVLFDPPKANIIDIIGQLKNLGVSLKVITGDNRLVAANVSQQMGLSETKIITGPDLGQLSDNALLQRVLDVEVFAEIEPNQKERIILALRKAGNVVGYMGGGINDASALHAADVGISVESAVVLPKRRLISFYSKKIWVFLCGVWVKGGRPLRVSKDNTVHNCTASSPAFPAQSTHMRIGIIGSGKMGAGLGRLWAKHGHYVMFSYSQRPEKLQDLVQEIGAHSRSGTPQEAVRFADVLLLAVPWAGIGNALGAAGPLDGKIVLSCVNPLGPLGLEVGLTSSAAEEISKLAPGATVIEAFNTIFAGILHSRAHLFGNNTPTVLYCGDDRNAKTKAAELIGDAGLHPVDAGPLQNARYIEPLAMLMMELAYSQRLGSDIAMRIMNPAGANEFVKSADVLARSFVVIFAGANSTSADEEVVAEDFVAYLPYSRYPVRGREKFEAQMKDFRSAFSHFQCDIDEVIDDGMRVAVRWTWRGTHSGELLGIAPTHRKIEFSETHLLRISGGRIAEDHVSANLLDLLHQLGATQFAAA